MQWDLTPFDIYADDMQIIIKMLQQNMTSFLSKIKDLESSWQFLEMSISLSHTSTNPHAHLCDSSDELWPRPHPKLIHSFGSRAIKRKIQRWQLWTDVNKKYCGDRKKRIQKYESPKEKFLEKKNHMHVNLIFWVKCDLDIFISTIVLWQFHDF